LFILSSFILFFHLGARPLLSSGEARAGEIALEMMKTGDFLVPYLNEEILLTKPPLFHWLIICCYNLFGVSEFSSRIVSALAGILSVLCLYLLGKRFWGEKIGFIAALFLLTSPIFFWSARCARIDSLLLFFMTSSMYCFWRGYEEIPKGRIWFFLWFIFMGVGTLAKGPIAFIAPIFTVILFLFFIKKQMYFRNLNWFWGIVLFICITAPWFIAIYFIVPHYKTEIFFIQQQGEWIRGGGPREWYKGYIYIPHLFIGFLPWSLALPLVFKDTWKEFKNRDDKTVFLWIWSGIVFCIFFFVGKKVSRYILPLYPSISLLAAQVVVRRNINRMFLWALAGLWSFIVLAISSFGLYEKFIDPELLFIIHKHVNWLIIGGTGLILVFLGIYGIKKKSFITAIVMMVVSIIVFVQYVIPIESEYYSPKPFCDMMKTIIPNDGVVRGYKSWDITIRYYFGRHVDVMREEKDLVDFLNSKDKVYCFMWVKVYKKIPEAIKSQMFILDDHYKVLENKVIFVSNKQ
jgi:4-amino-4-deoxy-L-arabinose transferase-like glycosyltransferase